MTHICASLLAADYARLGEEVQRATKAGVDSFHFDMMDGHYVPNLALTPDHLKALRSYSHLPFHAHLELDNPDDVLCKFETLQAGMIIVQWDTLTDPPRTFEKIRSQNMKVGLGLSPDDPLDKASRLFQNLDMLLLLGVYPGFGGQSMQPGTLEKIACGIRVQGIDWPHTAMDHRRVLRGIHPRESAQKVVTENADTEGNCNPHDGQCAVADDSPHECASGDWRL